MIADSDAMRYARQLLLPEIGQHGQEQLCSARARIDNGDARAREVASSYLVRAGMKLTAADETFDIEVDFAVASDARLLGAITSDPRLYEAAAWLAGSFAAVEAIKRVVHAGKPASLPNIGEILK